MFLIICLDECLAELLNSIDCTMSRRCLQIMSLDNESHGYHLTHKYIDLQWKWSNIEIC